MPLPCPTTTCTRTMPAHLHVCRACSAQLLRDLADVPSLAHHLDLALTRQTRFGTRDGGKSSETALPYDARARTAIHTLHAALVTWIRIIASDQQRPGPTCRVCDHPTCTWIHRSRTPADTLAATARWLLRQRAALLGHHAVVEAIDELGDAIRQARRAIDRPAATWYAGPCNIGSCTADLYARHGAVAIRCRECGGSHSAGAREDWLMKQVADQLGTATEIARALHGFRETLTPAMVRGYAHRGRIVGHGADVLGRPLYRVGDVLDLLNERIAG